MPTRIEKAQGIGFCYGVKRAIGMLESAAPQRGRIETLGAVVHNQQVIQRLAGLGIHVANGIDDIKGNLVAIGAHGVSPEIEKAIRDRNIEIIDTTCPFVHRAQLTARKLAEENLDVIVYGEIDHPEVKGILGWSNGRGVATLDEYYLLSVNPMPRRLGILSQTTQIPSYFTGFVKKVVEQALGKDSEIRVIDTICHDIRERQQAAFDLAKRVELMFVIGSHTSANTNHLTSLCGTVTETHLIETVKDIDTAWLKGKLKIGVGSGASTADETIDEVLTTLQKLVK